MAYLRNCWYQAGWSSEIADSGQLVRTIADVPVLMFRKTDGSLAALQDRCPHRFAPLSAGAVEGNIVRCGYHGLAFAGDGKCAANPHGPITSAMTVRSFPVVERHQAIWLWFGDADLADREKIPDLSFIDETPEAARIFISMPTAANYQLLSDNVLDLSHTDYLHPTTLGGVSVGAKRKAYSDGEAVVGEWLTLDCVPPPMYRSVVPSGNADVWMECRWNAPGVNVIGTSATPAGVARTPIDEMYTLHNMVPETATTSHYFVCSTRRLMTDDASFSASVKQALANTFSQEDKPMLEKQQQRMGTDDLWSLNPILLATDSAAVRARRKLDDLISAEQALT